MTFPTALEAIFYYMAAASVASAFLAVTRKSPVHSMLWVLALFLHVAGIFLLLGAEFLAAVQVIVYAGAILVFYLFVLMLLDLPAEEARPRFGAHWPFAALVGLAFVAFAALVGVAQIETLDSAGVGFAPAAQRTAAEEPPPGSLSEVGAEEPPPAPGSLSEVGIALFGDFALPFEMASLVLLAAIVGAVVLARRTAKS